MSFCNKGGQANGTTKWTLTRVGAYVRLEISSFRKLLETALVGAKQNLLFVFGTRYLFNVI
jgi:hypothetical protein